MNEYKYDIIMGGTIIARYLDISTALILIKALTEEYRGSMSTGETISIQVSHDYQYKRNFVEEK